MANTTSHQKAQTAAPSDVQPDPTNDTSVEQAAARAEVAKADAERAAEVKAAREDRKGKKLKYAVVVEDEPGHYVTVAPSEFNPNDFRSYDPNKPHSVDGVPKEDSEISYLLDLVKNPTAWGE